MSNNISPRHLRHRKRSRLRRSKDFKAFLAKLQTTLNGTGAAGVFTSALNSDTLTRTAHGLDVGEGPFLLSNSGGALPGLATNSRLYWVVAVPTADTFKLSTDDNGKPITFTTAGTGTNTMTKASTLDAVFQLLKEYGPDVLKSATDVDNLP